MTPYKSEDQGHRNDIDGLRALAVLIVVFYHIGLSDFGGGFVGVDVFFVISGYLIIPIVFGQIRNGAFSISEFMMRRVRRLVPAIIPAVAFSFLIALLCLADGALNEFLESAISATGFFSNYAFFAQTGYFDRDSDLKLLLHTWSLGVEFQFYLLLAILAVVLKLRSQIALLVLSCLSFVWAVYLVQNDNTLAFFGVSARLWELGLGGMFAFFNRFIARAPLPGGGAMRAAGLGIILSTAILYNTLLPFPGIAALLPTLGAGLILTAPAQKWDPTYWFLTNPVMRWFGTRSYSIYLWHWPLIVSCNLVLANPKESDLITAALLSLPLAELSYRFIETPVRKRLWWRMPRRTAAIGLLPFLVCFSIWGIERQASIVTFSRAYLPWHELRQFSTLAEKPRSDYLLNMNHIGVDGRFGLCSLDEYKTVTKSLDCLAVAMENTITDGRQPILIIGDSHGRDMFRTLGYAFPNEQFIMLYQSACAPAEYSPRATYKCFPMLLKEMEGILSTVDPKLVVLASHWPLAGVSEAEKTINEVKKRSDNILVIGPAPRFKNVVTDELLSLGLSYEDLNSETRLPARFLFDVYGARDNLKDITKRAGVYFYDRLSVLCDSTGCLSFVPDTERSLLYFDEQHLTEAGMKFLARDIFADDQIRRLVSASD